MTANLTTGALTSRMNDRAIGAVLGTAAGDALGSQYEFGPALADDHVVEFGVGYFGHARGEWTDDTSMAMPILQALARGDSLNDAATLERIVTEWREWSRTSPDVGAQTSSVLGALDGNYSEQNARAVSRTHHERTGRSGGNGSLMRSGPVALGYLEDGQETDLVDAARRIAQLTHWEDDNVDACVLWCLAIRHAIRTGELDIRGQLQWVPEERRERWAGLIDEALVPGVHPRDFSRNNGWVVAAFQAALAAVGGVAVSTPAAPKTQLVGALERAIRGGNDTDTVAAIAGSLAGALRGATQVPLAFKRVLHGWPGLDANNLTNLALLATRGGASTRDGWPTGERMPTSHFQHTAPRQHPHDDGVWLGSLSALDELPPEVSAVVSLSRVGATQVPHAVESIRVWLVDEPGNNANLDFVLTDAADMIATLRAEGKQVFVHCAEARSRTAAVAALYAIRHGRIELEQAWADVAAVLPHFAPAQFHRDAIAHIVARGLRTS
ncbi:MAG: ADP-ribosylglycohydrolase family protein [Microbacteriaceae bacterium]|nr:ADP-ribosylglycohydrolase family protein [Microbacteriaceae bacterium]